jgi:hypothetical protein
MEKAEVWQCGPSAGGANVSMNSIVMDAEHHFRGTFM